MKNVLYNSYILINREGRVVGALFVSFQQTEAAYFAAEELKKSGLKPYFDLQLISNRLPVPIPLLLKKNILYSSKIETISPSRMRFMFLIAQKLPHMLQVSSFSGLADSR